MKIHTFIHWHHFQRKVSRAMGFENITQARIMAAVYEHPGCSIFDLYVYLNVSGKDNRMQASIDHNLQKFCEERWLIKRNQGRYYMTQKGMQEKMGNILRILETFNTFVESIDNEKS